MALSWPLISEALYKRPYCADFGLFWADIDSLFEGKFGKTVKEKLRKNFDRYGLRKFESIISEF